MNREFLAIIVALGTIIILVLLLSPFYFSSAGTLSTVRDRLSRVKQGLESGVDHYVVFTTDSSVATTSVLILEFPDDQDGQWCRTAGTDLTVAGITEDSSTALPGTLSGRCFKGSGASSYDTIYVCSSDQTWAAATKYGVSIKDGSTGKLGTKESAANDIKVDVKTGYADTCTTSVTIVDKSSLALSILTDDQVAVLATVNPSISFSVATPTLDFGTLSPSAVRYATGATGGSASEPTDTTEVTCSTNAPNGLIVSIRSTGDGTGAEGNGSAGLYKSSSPTDLIEAATSTSVTAGTDGYGIYGTSASGLTIEEGFDNDETSDVAITTTSQTIFSATGPVSSGTAKVVAKAALAATTRAGSYADALTLVATGKF